VLVVRKSDNVLISFCLPSYNGEKYIRQALDSILNQYEDGIEVIVCDDNSQDETYNILKLYEKHECFSLYKNESNLGMDDNFDKVASLAKGEYLWLFGQDDVLLPGVISRIIKELKANSNTGVVYLNFSQHGDDLSDVISESQLHKEVMQNNSDLLDKDILFFKRSSDYFASFEMLPSFLPATIMKSKYWQDARKKNFVGTAYVQLAVMLLNIGNDEIIVFSKPCVQGRVPSDKWQENGNSHFDIMTGFLIMLKNVSLLGDYVPPKNIEIFRKRFILNYLFFIDYCKSRGLVTTQDRIEKLVFLFDGFFFKMYLLSILRMNDQIRHILTVPLKMAKKLILSVNVLPRKWTYDK